ncbi:hypothetical protein [Noviherbaspirillum galbum]|uniref:Uncharacterized protein n=1 Tax=Noviherbaspirillum galbum TaxID=2709383 RepID=A0A6B3SY57_9BURK|nr:hypothetical protein [Noviherbaspirillum galbum]NEX64206.1 hypothetical protein [Noviherbaspirillum galbum]
MIHPCVRSVMPPPLQSTTQPQPGTNAGAQPASPKPPGDLARHTLRALGNTVIAFSSMTALSPLLPPNRRPLLIYASGLMSCALQKKQEAERPRKALPLTRIAAESAIAVVPFIPFYMLQRAMVRSNCAWVQAGTRILLGQVPGAIVGSALTYAYLRQSGNHHEMEGDGRTTSAGDASTHLDARSAALTLACLTPAVFFQLPAGRSRLAGWIGVKNWKAGSMLRLEAAQSLLLVAGVGSAWSAQRILDSRDGP